MQASAVRSTRWSCWRTALTRKAGTSACRGLEKRCTLHPRQDSSTSVGDAPGRAQVSGGACGSPGQVEAAMQKSDHARSLDGAPRGNSSRDGNGTLDLCRYVSLYRGDRQWIKVNPGIVMVFCAKGRPDSYREAELNGECGICGAYLRLMRPCSDCRCRRVCAS